MQVGAKTAIRGLDWFADIGEAIAYRDAHGELDLPLPTMPGKHQADNAALAVAMLRHQSALTVSPEAMAEGICVACWPARLQLLGPGPLTALVPGRRVWLDGGHNRDAGEALARYFANRSVGASTLHLIIGMLATKNPSAIVGPLAPHLASITVVPIPGSEAHPPAVFGPAALSAPDVESALVALPNDRREVLIAGSLYLAGAVLSTNGEVPD